MSEESERRIREKNQKIAIIISFVHQLGSSPENLNQFVTESEIRICHEFIVQKFIVESASSFSLKTNHQIMGPNPECAPADNP
jgi:hypothetical protein